MRWLAGGLLGLLLLLQYRLWFADGGLAEANRLGQQLAEAENENASLTARHDRLTKEVLALQGGNDAVDKNAREIYRGHKWFDSCEKFCERWDQMSFDPGYTSYPLVHFEPMVREIFLRPPFDPHIVGDES